MFLHIASSSTPCSVQYAARADGHTLDVQRFVQLLGLLQFLLGYWE
jgi:hypothetical protein